MPDNVIEVYNFQGNEGEEVPKTVEKLIINEGIQVLPNRFCFNFQRLQQVTLPKNNGLINIANYAFGLCGNLLEIRIYKTVQLIGRAAFKQCELLAKLEFETSPHHHHQLQTIDEEAFYYCASLPRIKLPSLVKSIGRSAFNRCIALIEADLSKTRVTEISENAFFGCSSLRTTSLPKTLRRICQCAFYDCSNVVTVGVALNSRPVRIEYASFEGCSRLANLVLPTNSSAKEDSFAGCELLHQRYGEDSSHILAGLAGRFGNNNEFSIHRMCYYGHSGGGNSAQALRQRIADRQEEISLVDDYGMTPFHVLFSTTDPSLELLEVLLDSLSNQILKWKDATDRRPLEYLLNNWTDGTKSLVRTTLQKWMVDRVAHWGATETLLQSKVQEMLAEDDKGRRESLWNEAYSRLEHHENVETTSILEMSLWKWNLKSESIISDGTKRQEARDREECRLLSRSDIVIPSVAGFLGILPTSD